MTSLRTPVPEPAAEKEPEESPSTQRARADGLRREPPPESATQGTSDAASGATLDDRSTDLDAEAIASAPTPQATRIADADLSSAARSGSDARPSRSGRRTRRTGRNSSGDTLLSLPAPAEHSELELADELEELERRVDDLAARVRTLESAPRVTPVPDRGRPWLVWMLLLLAFGLAWRLLKAR
jgi:hypothetical protein